MYIDFPIVMDASHPIPTRNYNSPNNSLSLT